MGKDKKQEGKPQATNKVKGNVDDTVQVTGTVKGDVNLKKGGNVQAAEIDGDVRLD